MRLCGQSRSPGAAGIKLSRPLARTCPLRARAAGPEPLETWPARPPALRAAPARPGPLETWPARPPTLRAAPARPEPLKPSTAPGRPLARRICGSGPPAGPGAAKLSFKLARPFARQICGSVRRPLGPQPQKH